MSYFTLANGMKLYYEDTGKGEQTVIMMHGWTSNHEIYSEPVQRLRNKARCTIYDHRGHGNSKDANGEPTMETLASDLHELITGLSLSNITLVGWSMGAGVVMNYVRQYGCEYLRQIVLCDMSPKQLNDKYWHLGLYKGRYTQKDVEKNQNESFENLYQSFAIGAVPKLRKLPPFLLKPILKKRISACDESVVTSLSASMKAQDNRDVIEQITVPVTYFYASTGTLFSSKLADWYKRHVKTEFHAVPFPNSSHLIISENPEKFADEMEKVLSR